MSHVDGDAKEMGEEVQAYRAPVPRKKKWPQAHAMEPHRAIETRGTDNSSPTFKKVGGVVSCNHACRLCAVPGWHLFCRGAKPHHQRAKGPARAKSAEKAEKREQAEKKEKAEKEEQKTKEEEKA